MANEIVETKAIEQVSDSLYKGVSDIIDNARQEVVVYVNKHSNMMFWHIGHYINEDMDYKQYSAYGSRILATLSQRLTARYGKGYTYTAVTRMMKVARLYSDECETGTSPMVQNNWHESKKRISKERWLSAIQWMRENGFAPNV